MTPNKFCFLPFCIVSPTIKICLFLVDCQQKMTLISVCFHSFSIKPLNNFICVYFFKLQDQYICSRPKVWRHQLNLLCSLIQQPKRRHTCEYWKGVKQLLNLGVTQKVFLAMCCIRYQFSHVVFYLRQNCESFLLSLRRTSKHVIQLSTVVEQTVKCFRCPPFTPFQRFFQVFFTATIRWEKTQLIIPIF